MMENITFEQFMMTMRKSFEHFDYDYAFEPDKRPHVKQTLQEWVLIYFQYASKYDLIILNAFKEALSKVLEEQAGLTVQNQ